MRQTFNKCNFFVINLLLYVNMYIGTYYYINLLFSNILNCAKFPAIFHAAKECGQRFQSFSDDLLLFSHSIYTTPLVKSQGLKKMSAVNCGESRMETFASLTDSH